MNFSINISRENDQTFVNGSYYDNGQTFTIRTTQIDDILVEPIISVITQNSYIAGFVFTDGILYFDGAVFNGTHENVTYVNGLTYLHGLHNNVYYINNVATSLNYIGNGEHDGVTYYYGQPANGVIDGLFYRNGILATEYYNTTYYLNGVPTSLDSNGNGLNSGLYYVSGSLGTGEYGGDLYVEGNLISGNYNGLFYENGKVKNGWNDMTYYINGEVTTLDYYGNGNWNGDEYSGGVRI